MYLLKFVVRTLSKDNQKKTQKTFTFLKKSQYFAKLLFNTKIQLFLVALNISRFPGAPGNFSTENPAVNIAFLIGVLQA